MRKNSIKVVAFAALTGFALVGTLASCRDNDTPDNPTADTRHWSTDGGLKAADNLLFDGNQIGNGDKEFVFTGKQTLKRGTYTLKGWVYIAKGAELTIEPGTIIKGDKQTMATLIAERGGKIIAQGTADAPIVFTSAQPKGQRKPGDWGGVILCGNAPHNAGQAQIEGGPRTKHGGNDVHDNSGVLSYVRVEFAGYPFATDQEINGITFGSVGDGTKVDHVQVSSSNDDSYEWFGGNVNCKNLIAFNGWGDDFDTDNGFSGHVQYGLSVRDPRIADKSQSNGFESDNDASGSTASPVTNAIFSNMTFIGPRQVDANFANNADYITGGSMNPNNGSGLGKYQSAMQIRRGSRLNCINSLAMGWPIGLIIDSEKGDTREQAQQGNIRLQNVWFANMGVTGSDANKEYRDVRVNYVEKKAVVDESLPSFSSTFFLAQQGNRVADMNTLLLTGKSLIAGLNVDFMPTATSPLLNAASFDGVSSAWFDKVSYIGAFSSTADWLQKWTNFDPENTDY